MLSITWNGPETGDYLTESTYQFAPAYLTEHQATSCTAPSETHYDSVVDETQTQLVTDESQQSHLHNPS
jgi:hypothetical protein